MENNNTLAMVHDNLVNAVKQYEDYLLVFGTAPNMDLVEQLKKDVDRVLYHDGEDVTPFRQTATGLLYAQRKLKVVGEIITCPYCGWDCRK